MLYNHEIHAAVPINNDPQTEYAQNITKWMKLPQKIKAYGVCSPYTSDQ
jgi:hypothetical protein